jgi:putative metallohydrolase (TIGR04338 family)
MSADPAKNAVYAAENLVLKWLDSTTPESPAVRCLDDEFVPETEAKFADPESVQNYVDKALRHLRDHGRIYVVDGLDRTAIPITVRARRGASKAHYEYGHLPLRGVIAVPPREIGGGWSLRAMVALHELAHHLSPESGHGQSFQRTFVRLLEDVGMPTVAEMLYGAFGIEGLHDVADSDDRWLAQISKLLRHAEGTTNEHERDAFMSRAQTLATKHSIALAMARAKTAKEERREQPTWVDVAIGDQGKKSLARYARLMIEVAHANDLRLTLRFNSTGVTLFGFPSDIEVTKAMYASLVTQMVDAGDRYIRSGAHKSETTTVWMDDRFNRKTQEWEPGHWVEKPVHGSTARTAFYESYAVHIGQRLKDARKAQVAAAVEAEGESSSTELVLRAKEVEVVDHFNSELKRRGVKSSWRGDAKKASDDAPMAASAGRDAAQRARIGTEKELEA